MERSSRPGVSDLDGFQPRDHALIWVLAFLLHIALLIRFPVIYGGDTIVRLFSFPKILYSYQLPLFTILLNGVLRVFYSPWGVGILMASISAAGASGMAMLAGRFASNREASWAAVLFYLTHPFLLYYSRVPYQESLMLAAVLWGFYFLLGADSRRNLVLMSLSFAAASLTRYEGWIAAAAAASVWIYRDSGAPIFLRLAKAVLLFGWSPIFWIAWNLGLSPAGTFVLDLPATWDRFHRPYFVAKTALWWTPRALLLLAAAGLWSAFGEARRGEKRMLHSAFVFLLLLFFPMLLFSAHGIEPDAERFVTEREAFLPVACLVLYAASGYGFLHGRVRERTVGSPLLCRRIMLAAAVALAAANLFAGISRVAAANVDGELWADYDVAEFLRHENAGALVCARPLPSSEITKFLDQAERTGGPEGRRRARDLIGEAEAAPLDYQRIVTYSWMGKERIIPIQGANDLVDDALGELMAKRGISHLVVFDDFIPEEPRRKSMLSFLLGLSDPVMGIQAGGKGVTVYRFTKMRPPSGGERNSR